MATQIFVNLPVKDIQKTNSFFAGLGFSFNPQFSDEKATCMLINNDAYAMLLHEDFFKTFTGKEVADAHKTTEVLVCLSAESKDKVNEMVDKALSLGATEARASEDMGFMYSKSFHDLDGHIWEIMWMDASGFTQG